MRSFSFRVLVSDLMYRVFFTTISIRHPKFMQFRAKGTGTSEMKLAIITKSFIGFCK